MLKRVRAYLASQMKRGLRSALLTQTVACIPCQSSADFAQLCWPKAKTSVHNLSIKTRNEDSLISEGLRRLAGAEPSFELASLEAGRGFILEIFEPC